MLLLAFSGWGFSWKGLLDNKKGEWWLLGQLLVIGLHLLNPWPNSTYLEQNIDTFLTSIGIVFITIGTLLAIRAFVQLGPSLSPLPEPKIGALLITSGAYKHCRHPLYQALIICSSGSVIFFKSLTHLFLLIGLIILLKGKALREENKLRKIHPEYNNYLETTPAILPSIPFLDWRS